MNYKTAIIILTPAAIFQALMFNPVLALSIFLFAIVLYILLSCKFPAHQHRFSVKISILMFLGFYFYSYYQLSVNFERGEQLYSYIRSYQKKFGKSPNNLEELREFTASKIPMVRRGLINVPFDYVYYNEDLFEFSMTASFGSDKCYWRGSNGWDCPDWFSIINIEKKIFLSNFISNKLEFALISLQPIWNIPFLYWGIILITQEKQILWSLTFLSLLL